ncbi:ClbS/DfsB family four-helix bundle protein [Promineifilum sp.]|uniref:ClbS/DfsB family four-helix bundle protein n=1 Tax=Promineifilum sp. TaxID=2664178 RepID=UPI0035B1F6D3
MSDKQQTLALLTDEFNYWQTHLAVLTETELTARQSSGLSIKDVLGHLHAWQQLSIARLEAARRGQEPIMPDWVTGPDPDAEEDLEQFNATIHETYRQQPWLRVHEAWRTGFLRLLQLAEALPESDLQDAAKYPWLNGHALLDVLQGSYEHHVEHRDAFS